ncbi:hypothetical protein MMC16_003627 [Acarospora aff. strigata]|nr:hypothetical protein [Acarospora aff. strigata]
MAPKLPTRQLGKNGPQVTALGFGLMGLSAFYGKPTPDAERFAVLDRAYELGELNWDSADVYMDNEDLIGNWFKQNPGRREKIFLATKFGNVFNEDGTREIRNEPEYVKEACAKSLKRLGIECIDLYYCHRLDGKTPIEKMVQAMAELKKEGKIKYLGLSEVSSSALRRAHAVHPISAVQVEFSPFSMDIEDPQINILNTCRELGIAIVAYSPLGRGFVTGAYKSPDDFEEGDFRKYAPRFSKENFPKNLKLVEEITKLADRKKCTPGQLTLAWLLAQGEDVIPIPGTKKIKYLEENLGALEVKLEEGEVRDIRRAVENAEVHGERYPESFMQASYRDSPPLKE